MCPHNDGSFQMVGVVERVWLMRVVVRVWLERVWLVHKLLQCEYVCVCVNVHVMSGGLVDTC